MIVARTKPAGRRRTAQASTPSPPPAYHHGSLRDALLAAAEQELSEKGIEGFTLRGAAKRAGVSHAAPAHHFRDAAALLTALAGVGAVRFTQAMESRQASADPDPRSRLIAAGLGYIDFALANPALFHLMFGSSKPDFGDPAYARSAEASFMVLVESVAAVRGDDPMSGKPGHLDIARAWAVVHGLATLLIADRLFFLSAGLESGREATLAAIIDGALPRPG